MSARQASFPLDRDYIYTCRRLAWRCSESSNQSLIIVVEELDPKICWESIDSHVNKRVATETRLAEIGAWSRAQLHNSLLTEVLSNYREW